MPGPSDVVIAVLPTFFVMADILSGVEPATVKPSRGVCFAGEVRAAVRVTGFGRFAQA